MTKPKTGFDAIAEAKKDKNFKIYSDAASAKIRLAVEIYNVRIKNGLSQQQLAKMAHTTQKIISNIENADLNIGFDLLNRIIKILNLDPNTLALIFDCQAMWDFNTNNTATQSAFHNPTKHGFEYSYN